VVKEAGFLEKADFQPGFFCFQRRRIEVVTAGRRSANVRNTFVTIPQHSFNMQSAV
jgi:hypothetical protein